MRGVVQRVVAIGVVFCAGCQMLNQPPYQPKRIEEIRPNPPLFKSTSLTIQRRDFKSQLSRTTDNTVRLVPVFQSAVSSESLVYRMFDIKAKGIYTLMGLRNGDILVAVDGFLIKKPEQFVAYTELLQNEDSSTIEILRNGESMLMRYTLIPSVKQGVVSGTQTPEKGGEQVQRY